MRRHIGIPSVLKHRNLARLYAGQVTSMLGDSFYALTLLWMTQSLTRHSHYIALWLALVVGSGYAARVVVSPIAGVFVDRWRKRRAMMVSDAIRALLLAGLFLLFVTKNVHVSELIVFNFVLAAVGTVFAPANIALLRQLTPEHQLLQANSLFTTTQKTCEFLGPACCGLLIGWAGLAPAILFDGVSFVLSVLSLQFVHSDEQPHRVGAVTPKSILHDMGEGAVTIAAVPLARAMVPFMLAFNFLVVAMEILLVVFISNVLHIPQAHGATVLGLFQSAIALGDIVAGLVTGYIANRVAKEHMLAAAMGVSSLLIFLIGFSRSIWWIGASLLVISFSFMTSGIAFSTTLQLALPKDKLGRAWSLLSAAFNASIPLSQFVYTAIAAAVPIPDLYHAMGLLGMGVCGLTCTNPTIRRARINSAARPSADQSESMGAS